MRLSTEVIELWAAKYDEEYGGSRDEKDEEGELLKLHVLRVRLPAIGLHDRHGGGHEWMNPAEVGVRAWLKKDAGKGVAPTENNTIPYV